MDDEKIKCVACRELIWADASVCPHCRTSQKTSFHRVFLARLKEFSAITVIFTLIYAVSEFNRFVDAWLENSNYAERLATTASLLIDARDLEGADSILVEARKVYPSSKKVQSIQKKLAAINIRSINLINSKTEAESIRSSLSVLYRSLGGSDKDDANNLAHIAYASFLLQNLNSQNVDLKKLLDKALTLDKTSVYANTFMGYFYLQVHNFGNINQDDKGIVTLSKEERVLKAQHYFDVAIKQNINLNYVLKKQMLSLKNHSDASFSEYLNVMLATSVNVDRRKFYLKYKESTINSVSKKLYYAVTKYANGNEAMLKNIFLSLNSQEISAFNNLFKHASRELKPYPLILEAIRLYESGSKVPALEILIKQYSFFIKTGSGFRYRIPKIINKICKKTKSLDDETVILCDNFFENILLPEHFSR